MELANKRVLITGASQGLGRAIAQGLAAAGMDIALHYKQSAEQAQQTAEHIGRLSRKCFTVQADLCRPQQIQTMLEKVRSELGPIDALINARRVRAQGLERDIRGQRFWPSRSVPIARNSNETSRSRQDNQYPRCRRPEALGFTRSVLRIQGCPGQLDQKLGQGLRPPGAGQRRCPGNHRLAGLLHRTPAANLRPADPSRSHRSVR